MSFMNKLNKRGPEITQKPQYTPFANLVSETRLVMIQWFMKYWNLPYNLFQNSIIENQEIVSIPDSRIKTDNIFAKVVCFVNLDRN